MGLFRRSTSEKRDPAPQQAVLIHLDASKVTDEFWELQEKLYDVVGRSGAGEFDGNEIGKASATLFAYGPDAERLWGVMNSVLKQFTICDNARVVLRRGGPGSPETEVFRSIQ
jgi:hypothetical protein